MEVKNTTTTTIIWFLNFCEGTNSFYPSLFFATSVVKKANNVGIIIKIVLSSRASLKGSEGHPQRFTHHNLKATGLDNTINNKFNDSISGKRLSRKQSSNERSTNDEWWEIIQLNTMSLIIYKFKRQGLRRQDESA